MTSNLLGTVNSVKIVRVGGSLDAKSVGQQTQLGLPILSRSRLTLFIVFEIRVSESLATAMSSYCRAVLAFPRKIPGEPRFDLPL